MVRFGTRRSQEGKAVEIPDMLTATSIFSRPRIRQIESHRILDKMNREGETALTDEERRFLKDASRKLRP